MKVGVIVGRFQIPRLTVGHRVVFNKLNKDYDNYIIVLGDSGRPADKRYPFSVEDRKKMLDDLFIFNNLLGIVSLKDTKSDTVWSNNLDKVIQDLLGSLGMVNVSVDLLGSRDSFIKYYSGMYNTVTVEATDAAVSATDARKMFLEAHRVSNFRDYMYGRLCAVTEQYPTAYSTVDVAIFSPGEKMILLGRKHDEHEYRLIGGFLDPEKDDSTRDAAFREVYEETNIPKQLITSMVYCGNVKVNDWRYKSSDCKIFTNVFKAVLVTPHITYQAQDDIAELRWFEVAQIKESSTLLTPNHRLLLNNYIL